MRLTRRSVGIGLGVVLALAIVVGAITATGQPALDTRLDRSKVWVANDEAGLVGAVNTDAGVLEAIAEADSPAMDVLQSDAGVVVVDRASSTVRLLDPATGEQAPPVVIPPVSDVQLVGETVAVVSASTGDAFLTDLDALAAGERIEDPVAELGRGAVAALTATRLYLASPGLGRVLEVEVDSREVVESVDAPMSPTAPQLQLTALGDQWVLFDATSSVLSSGGWSTRVEQGQVALQLPGAADSTVVLATEDGVQRRTIGVEETQLIAAVPEGAPIRPLVRDGCVFAAWASGTALRACGGEPDVMALSGLKAEARLGIATRGAAIALTDAAHGDSWLVGADGALVDDWSSPESSSSEQPVEGGDDLAPTEEEPEQQPPVAGDDELGARPGAVTLLQVLVNDSDPNGDALAVVSVEGDPAASIGPDGRSVRLELAADAAGPIALEYVVSDGQGGTASAAVQVSVRAASENNLPEQRTPHVLQLAAGGQAVADALDGWVDPDGDPIVLLDARAAAADGVVFRGDGRLQVTDGGSDAVRDIRVTVSDGRGVAEGVVTVTRLDSVPLRADPVTVTTYVGQATTIEPLRSVRGGSGEVRLHNVNANDELDVTPNYVEGSIAYTASSVGTEAFTYVATDGSSTSTGEIRVLALPAVDASTAPQTLPHAVAVLPGGEVDVPVADLDIDPAGGVLLLNEVSEPTDGSVRATVVDQERVRIELAAPLTGPTVLRYNISNGVSEAEGSIVVVERSASAALQAPIARADQVRVRPGGAVDIPVLANDEHPDDAPIELIDAVSSETSGGLLFVDGSRVRFVAPPEPGTVSATYEIRGPDGQTASAALSIVVAEADAATNAPPVPPSIDARVVAGEEVEIPIDLSAADPNGDEVQLLGQSSPAALGTVTQTGDALRFEAGDYSVGTDVLQYVVADELGARATGTVRVGVAAPDAVVGAPIAEPDDVVMRPNTSLAVDVVGNDFDPAGLRLDVADVESEGAVAAGIEDGQVVVEAPSEPGEYGVVVTIENSRGSTAVGWLRVVVDPSAPPPDPVVSDVTVPLTAMLDRETVLVEPLETATVADGAVDELRLSLPLDQPGTTLRDERVEIAVQDRSRIVPYTVTRSDTGASATALIFVPGRLDALPQLRTDAPPIVVDSGETIEIDLDDYIVTVDGGPVIITDAASVLASHANGSQPVVDENTVRFTSAPGYFGPANIAVEVTDGDSPRDPDGRVALLVLPIQVEPGENVAARVLGATIQLEPGQERVIDLQRITAAAGRAAASAPLTWGIASAVPQGFTATVEGSSLTVTAADEAPAGTQGIVSIGVDGAGREGFPGDLNLVVISSTRPLAAPQPDQLAVTRGTSATVDVLANDQATNPFPLTPLTIGEIRSSVALPPGIAIDTVEGSSQIAVTAADDARVGAISVRYQVLDATSDPRRTTWGTLSLLVQDVPEAPAPPVRALNAYVDGAITVQLTPPADNFSPITSYVVLGPGFRQDCGRSTTCTITNVPAGSDVRLQAVAVNAIGESEPSAPSEPMHVDRLPDAVTGITATPTAQEGVASLAWQPVGQPTGGTPVRGYLVRVTGPGVDVTQTVDATVLQTTVGGLQPGQAYRVDVAAVNDAGVPTAAWRWSETPLDFTAVGRPGNMPIAISGYDPGSGAVTASWAVPTNGGGTQLRYVVSTIGADEPAPSCASTGNGTPVGQAETTATVTVDSAERRRIVVAADNGWFCSVSVSDIVYGTPDPVPASAVAVDVSHASTRDALDILIERATLPQGQTMQARIVGAGSVSQWADVVGGSFVTPSPFTVAYGQDYVVEVRACAANGGVRTCGAVSSAGAVRPLSLLATLAPATACTWGTPLTVQQPANPGAPNARTEVLASLQGADGRWSAPAPYTGDIVPPQTRAVRLTGHVALDDIDEFDPVPTEVACSL